MSSKPPTVDPTLGTYKTHGLIKGAGPIPTPLTYWFIFIGSSWNTTYENLRVKLENDIRVLFDSKFFDHAIQYPYLKRPILGDIVVDADHEIPSGWDVPQLLTVITNAIAAGLVPSNDPPPPPGVTHVYYIMPPPNISDLHPRSSLGYHFSQTLTSPTTQKKYYIIYAVNQTKTIEDDIGNWVSPPYDQETATISHEIMEMITDPVFPLSGNSALGWVADPKGPLAKIASTFGGEISDVCVSETKTSVAGVAVNTYWSDKDGKCIFPTLKPTWITCPAGYTWNDSIQKCINTLNPPPTDSGDPAPGTGDVSTSDGIPPNPILASKKAPVSIGFGGGPYFSPLDFYFIFVGDTFSTGGSDAATFTKLSTDIETIFHSPFFDYLIQYGLTKRPIFKACVIDPIGFLPNGFTDTDLRIELRRAQYTSKVVPPNISSDGTTSGGQTSINHIPNYTSFYDNIWIYDIRPVDYNHTGITACSDIITATGADEGSCNTYTNNASFTLNSLEYSAGTSDTAKFEIVLVTHPYGQQFAPIQNGSNVLGFQFSNLGIIIPGHQYKREMKLNSSNNQITFKVTDLTTGVSDSISQSFSGYSSSATSVLIQQEWHPAAPGSNNIWRDQYSHRVTNLSYSTNHGTSYTEFSGTGQTIQTGWISNSTGVYHNENPTTSWDIALNGLTVNKSSSPPSSSTIPKAANQWCDFHTFYQEPTGPTTVIDTRVSRLAPLDVLTTTSPNQKVYIFITNPNVVSTFGSLINGFNVITANTLYDIYGAVAIDATTYATTTRLLGRLMIDMISDHIFYQGYSVIASSPLYSSTTRELAQVCSNATHLISGITLPDYWSDEDGACISSSTATPQWLTCKAGFAWNPETQSCELVASGDGGSGSGSGSGSGPGTGGGAGSGGTSGSGSIGHSGGGVSPPDPPINTGSEIHDLCSGTVESKGYLTIGQEERVGVVSYYSDEDGICMVPNSNPSWVTCPSGSKWDDNLQECVLDSSRTGDQTEGDTESGSGSGSGAGGTGDIVESPPLVSYTRNWTFRFDVGTDSQDACTIGNPLETPDPVVIYDVEPGKHITSFEDMGYAFGNGITEMAAYITTPDSILYRQVIKKVAVKSIRRITDETDTGPKGYISCYIMNFVTKQIITYLGPSINVEGMDINEQTLIFDASENTYPLGVGDMVVLWYWDETATVDRCLRLRRSDINYIDGVNSYLVVRTASGYFANPDADPPFTIYV